MAAIQTFRPTFFPQVRRLGCNAQVGAEQLLTSFPSMRASASTSAVRLHITCMFTAAERFQTEPSRPHAFLMMQIVLRLGLFQATSITQSRYLDETQAPRHQWPKSPNLGTSDKKKMKEQTRRCFGVLEALARRLQSGNWPSSW